jgi:hypothetical protein
MAVNQFKMGGIFIWLSTTLQWQSGVPLRYPPQGPVRSRNAIRSIPTRRNRSLTTMSRGCPSPVSRRLCGRACRLGRVRTGCLSRQGAHARAEGKDCRVTPEFQVGGTEVSSGEAFWLDNCIGYVSAMSSPMWKTRRGLRVVGSQLTAERVSAES